MPATTEQLLKKHGSLLEGAREMGWVSDDNKVVKDPFRDPKYANDPIVIALGLAAGCLKPSELANSAFMRKPLPPIPSQLTGKLVNLDSAPRTTLSRPVFLIESGSKRHTLLVQQGDLHDFLAKNTKAVDEVKAIRSAEGALIIDELTIGKTVVKAKDDHIYGRYFEASELRGAVINLTEPEAQEENISLS